MLRTTRLLRSQQQLIEQLQQTNELLSQLPDQIARGGGSVVIENLHVDSAHLDKLLFQLDRVDVQELSGTLNLGNNFRLDEAKTQVSKNTKNILTHLLDQKSLVKPEPPPQPTTSDGSDGARTSPNRFVQTNKGYAVEIGIDGEAAGVAKASNDDR
ncbi:hypothetical protein [Alicyclobacillus sp. ALC3]|uniref:hypothetical protein n=1 Tax=Alicyclobacillus sp. ALC3 TaxID=2796143 RepID=UPI002379E615|nr:hypothetical protein [Alicyclobacillus sp. ALC3]WDL95528.1 hypothetical protein JC200_14140 [Alicyclobacillus sp. ALC3]